MKAIATRTCTVMAVFVTVGSTLAIPASVDNRTLEFHCAGLEDFEIRTVHGIDAGYGTVRSKSTGHSIGIELGSVAPRAPSRRPAGYRWYKTDTIGGTTLKYGFKPKTKTVEATIVGAPITIVVNLVGTSGDQEMLLGVARALATSQCTWVEIER